VYHAFGIKDAKGREIGANVYTRMATYVALTDAEAEARGVWYTVAPGTYFQFMGPATRDGKTYGAAQRYRNYETEDARARAIWVYLQGARKRAGLKN
jgi:hypothetical protein